MGGLLLLGALASAQSPNLGPPPPVGSGTQGNADELTQVRGLLNAGELDEAVGRLEAYVEERPDEAEGHRLLAGALERLWREAGASFYVLEDARAAWDRALALDPLSVASLQGAAALEFARGNWTESAVLGMRAFGTAKLSGVELPAGLLELVVRARVAAFQSAPAMDDERYGRELAATWNTVRTARAESPGEAVLALTESGLLRDLGLPVEAVEATIAALAEAPADTGLHQRLIDLHTANGLVERLPSVYAPLVEANDAAEGGPSPIVPWYDAYAHRLLGDHALRERRNGLARVSYTHCVEALDRVVELEPSYAESALSIRIPARVARASAMISDLHLEQAEEELFDLLANHLEWRDTPDGLNRTMMGGVSRLAGRLAALNRYEEAAEVARRVLAILPEEGLWWNNLAFFLREYGTQIEQGVLRSVERSGAHAVYVDSWAAYQRAMELAPEDARVINDAALIQVYHLRDELELARELLWKSIRLGEAQLAELGADPLPSERFPIAEAVGDAYQNLGFLDYHVEGRQAESREHWLASMATDSGDRSAFQRYVDAIDGKREPVEEPAPGGGFLLTPRDALPGPPGLRFEATLEDALAAAGEGLPVLVHYRGSGKNPALSTAELAVRSARFREATQDAVLLVADASRHLFVDRTSDGRRAACSRWDFVTCAEHIALAEAFAQRLREVEGVDPGERAEGLWMRAPGAERFERCTDVLAILDQGLPWPIGESPLPSLGELERRAYSGDFAATLGDPRLAVRLIGHNLLFAPQPENFQRMARAMRAAGDPWSIECLDAAIRQDWRPELALAALEDWNGGELSAVEQAARWSSEESVRAAAEAVLERELEGWARRALARTIVASR